MEEELEKQTHAMEQERKVLFAKLAKEELRFVTTPVVTFE